MTEFSVRFRSTLAHVKAAESLWNVFLEAQALPAEKRYWLSLSIHELAINAIVHGNREDERKWVSIEMEGRDGMLEVRITDEGCQERLPEIVDPTREENLLKNHGRGLYIVQNNVDELDLRLVPRQGLQAVVRMKLNAA
jgi:anti-sigma regulatory factor (Ser/Thr protein kinase)